MQATPAPPLIDPKLIVPFVNSVRNVFSTMVKVKTVIERPAVKQDSRVTHDVSGVIGFSGALVGTVVVSFTRQAGESLVEAFAGRKLRIDTPDFAGAVGELSNMIAGAARSDLGSTVNMSAPSVVIGSEHRVPRLDDVPCLLIPCKTPAGDFAVEVSIKPTPSETTLTRVNLL